LSQSISKTQGRVALVTGGGAGIGEATCLWLARHGYAVAVLGRDPRNCKEVSGRIAEAGGTAISVSADVSDRGQLEAAIAKVRRDLGPIHVLVNNAGIEDFTPFQDVEEELWDRLMEVNLKGVYFAVQIVLPDMIEAGWGRIINLSALGAQSGAANMAAYTASKGGVVSMTRSLAVELGPKGVTVNAVSPGFVLTPMSQRAIDGGLFPVPPEQILASYPIPRIGRPEEVAAAIGYLASEDAGYVTGQVLAVNGGAYL
jgi:NAD(P)-dependent dehydrogenase (short-subunit alcohol dehydrogenase family)